MHPPLMRGPIPAESNPPINPQYYEPSRFVISAITRGENTTITTSVDHNYVIGQLVRLLIPMVNGTRSLNESSGYVIQIPAANQVVLDIYSADADAFIPSAPTSQSVPQIMAIGDNNSGILNASGRIGNGTFIPGSFINISP